MTASIAVALAPVLLFLGVLVVLDSFKLVRYPMLAASVAADSARSMAVPARVAAAPASWLGRRSGSARLGGGAGQAGGEGELGGYLGRGLA